MSQANVEIVRRMLEAVWRRDYDDGQDVRPPLAARSTTRRGSSSAMAPRIVPLRKAA